VAPLVGSLTDDVTVVTDLPSPHAVGRAQVAASLLATLRRLPRGTVLAEEPVNGEPGVVGRAGGRPVCALAVQSEGGRARVVLVVTNPARLAGLAPPARDRAPTRRMP
jgi:hypothetical protein